MPYNVTSTNPDQKFDNLVDRQLAEILATLANQEARMKYLEGRVK